MFIKPISFIVILLISSLCLLIVSLPIIASFIGIVGDVNLFVVSLPILLFIFVSLLCCYFVVDYIFGLSLLKLLKNCKRYDKLKEYDFLTSILQQVKEKFNQPNLHIFIKDSSAIAINSFANLHNKVIIINKGLIDNYMLSCKDTKMFVITIRSLIAKETSHLINKDFVISMLVYANKSLIKKITKIYFFLLLLLTKFCYVISGKRQGVINTAIFCKKILFWLSDFFILIVNCIYFLLQTTLFRFIEYRACKQASFAFGGNRMVLALSMLPAQQQAFNGNHNQIAKCMQKLNNIKSDEDVIIVSAINHLANFLIFALTIVVLFKMLYFANIHLIAKQILASNDDVYRKVSVLWKLLKKIY